MARLSKDVAVLNTPRNSYRRGRSPRSPDNRPTNNPQAYRDASPRSLKRPRDDRRDSRWEGRRDDRRNDRRDGGRDYRDNRDGRDYRNRGGRYDGRGGRDGRDNGPRARSRSPRGGRSDRDLRDRHDYRDRPRDRRDDRGRGREDWPGQLSYGEESERLTNTQAKAETARPKGVAFDLGGSLETPGAPPTPREWPEMEPEPEPEPVDEEEEIRRRRARRENTMRKFLAATAETPAAASPATETNTQVTTPDTGSMVNTPRSADALNSEDLDLADDRAFMDALGKHNANDEPDTQDGPSAADYDPTGDMEIDERRDELRHGTQPAAEDGMDVDGKAYKTAAAAAEAPAAPAAQDTAEEDDDDMFAEDFVEKRYENAKADTTPAVRSLPAAPAKVGILDGDDHQGYYKIRHGELLDGRYQVITALGKGMFSGVARARDMLSEDKREVAIKIMRNNDALRKGGFTEIAILQKLNEADPENKKHLVRFERSFDYRGHLCMAFENLSMNLREVLKKFGNNVGINLHGVRVFAYQIFVGLAHMRRCSIIHADLKPDNILVNETRTMLKICDLGTAIDRSDAASAHNEITPYLVSRFYRAPEIILGMPYDYAVDMWSIGCTLYELYTGKILFTGESNNQMLRAMMEVRGKISSKLYRRGELWPMHFDDMGCFLSQEHDKFQAKTTIKTMAVVKPTRDLRARLTAASVGLDDVEAKELSQFHDLLDRCLCLNPDKRILPTDALKHPFFTQRPGR